jgi:hypothetical protein
MILHYVLIVFFALIGSFAGVLAAFHYQHTRAVQKVIQNPHREVRTESRICTSCRSHVMRYEELPNNHIMCANCSQDRKHAARKR